METTKTKKNSQLDVKIAEFEAENKDWCQHGISAIAALLTSVFQ